MSFVVDGAVLILKLDYTFDQDVKIVRLHVHCIFQECHQWMQSLMGCAVSRSGAVVL